MMEEAPPVAQAEGAAAAPLDTFTAAYARM
jgi:hypothetical protein